MPTFNIIKEHKPSQSFRVKKIIDKFDLSTDNIIEKFSGEINFENKNWNVGIIVGKSGSGKTTIAKQLFENLLFEKFDYLNDNILDDMPKNKSIDEITKIFNSVGFSSPPSWLKPYSVLSNGEKMRVDLARNILEEKEMIVFDEFTSVVDRNIAKIGSFAISKAIKKLNKKFIALSCHYDIIEWLEPDWIFNTDEMKFEYCRGLVSRPKIKFELREKKGLWNIFKKYHYLNHNINNASKQFVLYYENMPVAFCAYLHQPHSIIKNLKRITRLVVLPDFQGIGIGKKLLDTIAEHIVNNNFRLTIVTSTPTLYMNLKKDKKWICKSIGNKQTHSISKNWSSNKRKTISFEYKKD
jgi:ABC-type lipoprotein export system ATPase subunit